METHSTNGAGPVRLVDLLPKEGAGSAEREPTEGSEKSFRSPNANAVQKVQNALAFRGKEGSGEPSGAEAASDVDELEGFARYLATTLGDTHFRNLAFYRLAVRSVSKPVLLDALCRAKDARDVRKSRAHLFAFLVRDHLPNRNANHPRHV